MPKELKMAEKQKGKDANFANFREKPGAAALIQLVPGRGNGHGGLTQRRQDAKPGHLECKGFQI